MRGIGMRALLGSTTLLCAFASQVRAQDTAGREAHQALVNAIDELVTEIKQRVRPDQLGRVAVLALTERTGNAKSRGATEAGDYVRSEVELALDREGFKLSARDNIALGEVYKEICKSSDGLTSDQTAKTWGEAHAADSLVMGHLDKVGRRWKIYLRIVKVNKTTLEYAGQRFVPLASIPAEHHGRPLIEAKLACDTGKTTPKPPPRTTPRRIVAPLEVGVMPWGGFAGGLYFNGGLEPSDESRFKTEYGINVRFRPVTSIQESIQLWKDKRVEVLWITVDDLPTEYAALSKENPRIILQTAWSRGEESLIVRNGIKTLNDLKGRSVVLTPETPAHSFLLVSLDLAGLTYDDVNVIPARNSADAARRFIAKQGDAVIVWEPDDQKILKALGKRVEILETTKDADFLIAESLLAKRSALATDGDRLRLLVKGWLRANAEIEANIGGARDKAARILAQSFKSLSLKEAQAELATVRLATYGDNRNFFGLDRSYRGETGQDLYDDFWVFYRNAGYAHGRKLPWTSMVDLSLLSSIRLVGDIHEAEPPPKYTDCRKDQVRGRVLSDKPLDVRFKSGKWKLTRAMERKVDDEFGHLAQIYLHDCILIEGNTDDIGDAEDNRILSYQRAKSVRDHLIEKYGFSKKRFILKGNGEDKPVAGPPFTKRARSLNRRTDFELLRSESPHD